MRAIAIGIPFIRRKISGIITAFNWGTSTPTKVWGTATTETWG
jgi:hypothetical protein